jgi:hypothetical protein
VPSIRSALGSEPPVNFYTHVGQGYFKKCRLAES